ncbi:MAG: 1,2-phenylacetyl-CoA epoxidase subunit PaaC [Pseudomonadota bacterium]
MSADPIIEFALRMGDNTLVLGQRVCAWCGHAPVLEEDIAFANIALDLIGQTRMWLGLAGELEGKGRTADDLAYWRNDGAFRNCLLTEQPNGDFGHTLMRQYLFDAWHYPMLTALTQSSDPRIAEIAAKSVKEVAYHLDRSRDLVIRLGDGTPVSHDRMQTALDALWRFSGELTTADEIDDVLAASGVAPALADIEAQYREETAGVFRAATLTVLDDAMMQTGGKTGFHSEALGPLLAEMQFLHRSHPGATW